MDNIPDFEPLEGALTLLRGRSYCAESRGQFGAYGYQQGDGVQKNEEEQQESLEEATPQQKTERVVSGLDKLLTVRALDCLL